jgi:hypothetical protein
MRINKKSLLTRLPHHVSAIARLADAALDSYVSLDGEGVKQVRYCVKVS